MITKIIFIILLAVSTFYGQGNWIDIDYTRKGEVEFTFTAKEKEYVKDFGKLRIIYENERSQIVKEANFEVTERSFDETITEKLKAGTYRIRIFGPDARLLGLSDYFKIE